MQARCIDINTPECSINTSNISIDHSIQLLLVKIMAKFIIPNWYTSNETWTTDKIN